MLNCILCFARAASYPDFTKAYRTSGLRDVCVDAQLVLRLDPHLHSRHCAACCIQQLCIVNANARVYPLQRMLQRDGWTPKDAVGRSCSIHSCRHRLKEVLYRLPACNYFCLLAAAACFCSCCCFCFCCLQGAQHNISCIFSTKFDAHELGLCAARCYASQALDAQLPAA